MRAFAGRQDGETWVSGSFGFRCVFVTVILALAFTGNTLTTSALKFCASCWCLAWWNRRDIPAFLDLNMKAAMEVGATGSRRPSGIYRPIFLVAGALGQSAAWIGKSALERRKFAGDQRQGQHCQCGGPITLWIASLLAVLTWSGMVIAADIKQTTGGPCSSTINGNRNTVNCSDVDPRAMRRLEDLLDMKDHDIKQKIDDANEWARKYTELNTQLTEARRQLAAAGEDATQVQDAQDLLHEGKLEEARKIYDRLIVSDEANVDRAAQDHFARATIFALQFHMVEALPDYAEAYQLRPKNAQYASEYALAAFSEGQYADAERVWTAALQLNRDLAAHDPGVYRPYVAATLDNLGSLYSDTGRLDDAEKAFTEALKIRRDLAAHNPGAFRSDVAQTLNNLAILYSNTDRLDDAEKAFTEALTIYRDLAAHDPSAYRPYVAGTLNNLGILYRHTGRRADADKAYSEALIIYRELAARDPGGYRPSVANTLNNLGGLYNDTGRLAKADKAYSKALTIRRDLAARDPGAYRPSVANTLNNLGIFYGNSGRLDDADKAFSEALAIYRDLLSSNPNPTYASEITSLTNKITLLTKMRAELRGRSPSSPPYPAPHMVSSSHKDWYLLTRDGCIIGQKMASIVGPEMESPTALTDFFRSNSANFEVESKEVGSETKTTVILKHGPGNPGSGDEYYIYLNDIGACQSALDRINR